MRVINGWLVRAGFGFVTFGAFAAPSEDVVRGVVSAWAKRVGLDHVVVTCAV